MTTEPREPLAAPAGVFVEEAMTIIAADAERIYAQDHRSASGMLAKYIAQEIRQAIAGWRDAYAREDDDHAPEIDLAMSALLLHLSPALAPRADAALRYLMTNLKHSSVSIAREYFEAWASGAREVTGIPDWSAIHPDRIAARNDPPSQFIPSIIPRTPDGLADVGRLMHGDDWQAALARDLGINRESIRRFLNGRQPLPPDHKIWLDVANLLRQAAISHADIAARCRRMAEMVAPEEGGW